MSPIRYGDPTWRLHDKLCHYDGSRTLFFRRWGCDFDCSVPSEVFAGRRVDEPPVDL